MEDGVHPLCVVVSGLLFVGQVSVSLRQAQEPSDGAQVLPQCTVLWAGVLLPSKQFTQPTLEKSLSKIIDRKKYSKYPHLFKGAIAHHKE